GGERGGFAKGVEGEKQRGADRVPDRARRHSDVGARDEGRRRRIPDQAFPRTRPVGGRPRQRPLALGRGNVPESIAPLSSNEQLLKFAKWFFETLSDWIGHLHEDDVRVIRCNAVKYASTPIRRTVRPAARARRAAMRPPRRQAA